MTKKVNPKRSAAAKRAWETRRKKKSAKKSRGEKAAMARWETRRRKKTRRKQRTRNLKKFYGEKCIPRTYSFPASVDRIIQRHPECNSYIIEIIKAGFFVENMRSIPSRKDYGLLRKVLGLLAKHNIPTGSLYADEINRCNVLLGREIFPPQGITNAKVRHKQRAGNPSDLNQWIN